MALTGLQIQKLLPKTNCKECGSNTCLAFAMKLAARKAEIALCPYASDEAVQTLGAAYEPPVKSLRLGPNNDLPLGEETVLYRHDKTFVSPTLLAVNVDASTEADMIETALATIKSYTIDRVGEIFHVDMVAVTQGDAPSDTFVEVGQKAVETTGKPLILRSADVNALERAGAAVKSSRSVLAPTTIEACESLWPVAKENGHVLAITAPDLNALVGLAEKLKTTGFHDLILQLPAYSLAERFQIASIARRVAIKDSFKPLGYPFLHFAEGEVVATTVEAVNDICKYGGISVLPFFDAAQLATLMTLRLNIYTDPQKPIQVEPKVYAIGEPTPDSPVFLTTNFSLTYFMISGEIENAGVSGWLVVPECEGMSVLTAWAAGRFSGASIAKFCKEVGLEEQVRCRDIIIPGFVAQISGELEEKMPGWNVIVGPQEASDLESFVKARLA
ncbi:acetyl-CoA decarbonylase/synthase complex subunit gamma [Myxococcota bacterium]